MLAAKLAAFQKAHGLDTAQALGDKIGVSRQTAGRLLEGDHSADLDTLQAIGRAFNIHPSKLIEGEVPDEGVVQKDKAAAPKTPTWLTPHSVRGDTPSKNVKTATRNSHKKP